MTITKTRFLAIKLTAYIAGIIIAASIESAAEKPDILMIAIDDLRPMPMTRVKPKTFPALLNNPALY